MSSRLPGMRLERNDHSSYPHVPQVGPDISISMPISPPPMMIPQTDPSTSPPVTYLSTVVRRSTETNHLSEQVTRHEPSNHERQQTSSFILYPTNHTSHVSIGPYQPPPASSNSSAHFHPNHTSINSNAVPRLSEFNMQSPVPLNNGLYDSLEPSPAPDNGSSGLRDGSVIYARSQATIHPTSVLPTIQRVDYRTVGSSSAQSSIPPSPSKKQRPFSFSWNRSPLSKQSFLKAPWLFCTGSLIPQCIHAIKTRRCSKWLLSVILILALLLAYCFLPRHRTPPIRVLTDTASNTNGASLSSTLADPTYTLTELYSWIGSSSLPRGRPEGQTQSSEPASSSPYSFSPLSYPQLRQCLPTDLQCRLRDIPFHTSSNGRRRKRVLLVVVNAGFEDMALNLICSGDMVGGGGGDEGDAASTSSTTSSSNDWLYGRIPHSAWLVACSDDTSYDFFIRRGIAAVRMNRTSALTPKAQVDTSIGAGASSWGEQTHININREKVPLLLTLMELELDVVLIDADVVFLRSLAPLWDQPQYENTDLQIMYDWPGISTPNFGPQLGDCLIHALTNTSNPCRLVWEMNGGFFLLRSSPATIALLHDMIDWLKLRPTDHDQDALRFALKTRAQAGQVAWRLEDGSNYPPAADLATDPDHPILTYRFVSNLLAPNGGFFFLDGRANYLEASAREGILSPIAVHVNWIVGYERKSVLMKQYGWWFISSTTNSIGSDGQRKQNGQQRNFQPHCRHRILAASKDELTQVSTKSKLSDRPLLKQLRVPDPVVHQELILPPANPHRVHDAASVRALTHPPYAATPSATLLLFTTPKPIASFQSFPKRRSPDADGMGGYDPDAPENQYSPEARTAYLGEQKVQFDAQATCFRNWFSLTHTPSTNVPSLVNMALFSNDPSHGRVAREFHFDFFREYDTDEYGMPKLHSLFQQAELLARKKGIDVAMYTNGDLMYHPTELARTTAAIQAYGFSSFLAVGMRKNVESKVMSEQMNARDQTEVNMIKAILQDTYKSSGSVTDVPQLEFDASGTYFSRLNQLSHPYRTDAMDFFMWSPGFFDYDIIPDFILGRIGYDNFLVHYGNTKARAEATHGFGQSVVIDLSQTVDAIHINHGTASLQPITIDTTSDDPTSIDHTLNQVLSRNSDIRSHFQPNTMVNIRLGGQSSIKGLGKLEHIGWRTVRLGNNEIHVVKTRPESGHITELYDVALEAHILIHSRPTLTILPIDNAHIPHLKNWLWHYRRAWKKDGPRDSTIRMGVLVLSGGTEVTQVCQQLGVSVFELAPGDRSNAMLNGPPTANLQIASLKARTIMFLLEFGYDVLVTSVTTIWKRNPFTIMAERVVLEGKTDEESMIHTERVRKDFNMLKDLNHRNKLPLEETAVQGNSFNPVSPIDGLPLGSGLDLIAFAYDSSPYNVSTSCVYYRHTPGTLKLWKRLLHELLSLTQRATLKFQLNYYNLGLDWFLQYELYQNYVNQINRGRITWGSIILSGGVFPHDDLPLARKQAPSIYSSFPHRPAGPILDPDLIMTNGYWFDRPGGLGEGFAEENRLRLKEAHGWNEQQSQRKPSQKLLGAESAHTESADETATNINPCASGEIACGRLSADELALVLSAATTDRSVLVVPVARSSSSTNVAAVKPTRASSPINVLLARAVELQFKNIILICQDSATLNQELEEEYQPQFMVLYGSGLSASDSDAPPFSVLFTVRMYQILSEGIAIGLVNLDTSILFGNPFEFYSNHIYELKSQQQLAATLAATHAPLTNKEATQQFLHSQGFWSSSLSMSTPAMIRPLFDLDCDLFSHTASSVTSTATPFNRSLLFVGTTAWTFINLQPTEQSQLLVGKWIECSSGSNGAAPSTVDALNLACLQSVSSHLQSVGELSICAVDPDYFPSANSFFEPPPSYPVTPPAPSTSQSQITTRVNANSPWRHVSETGVYPLVIPSRYHNIVTGRIQSEWLPDWREKLLMKPVINFPSSLDTENPRQLSCLASSITPSDETSSFLFRIRILSFTRARSLQRLLESLNSADFLADSGRILLEVSVDRSVDEAPSKLTQQQELSAAAASKLESHDPDTRLQVLKVLHGFAWKHGRMDITLQPRHIGLVGQWISQPLSEHDRDLTLVLEDDMEVSPLFYTWLKGAICTYFLDPQQFDPALFGISLQNQHYVVGQSAKNSEYQLLRFKEERVKERAGDTSIDGSGQDDKISPSTIDPAALFDIPSVVGDSSLTPIYRYQLVGTWGLLVFPRHWNTFRSWYDEKQAANEKLLAGGQPDELFEPCVPHLESSSWWASKKTSVWSQWFIRYAFERGWYGLYPNTPPHESFAINHREAGANYHQSLGARDTLLLKPTPVSDTIEPYLSSSAHHQFAYPPLSSTPLFDYHLQRITVAPILLSQRRIFHTDKQFKRGCVLKDYKPFTTND